MKIFYENKQYIETGKCKCGNMIIFPKKKCIICMEVKE